MEICWTKSHQSEGVSQKLGRHESSLALACGQTAWLPWISMLFVPLEIFLTALHDSALPWCNACAVNTEHLPFFSMGIFKTQPLPTEENRVLHTLRGISDIKVKL